MGFVSDCFLEPRRVEVVVVVVVDSGVGVVVLGVVEVARLAFLTEERRLVVGAFAEVSSEASLPAVFLARGAIVMIELRRCVWVFPFGCRLIACEERGGNCGREWC